MPENKDKKSPKVEEETQADFYVGVVERKDPRMTEERIHEKLGDIHKNKVHRLTEEEKEIIRRWREWGLKDLPENWKELIKGKPSPSPDVSPSKPIDPTISVDKAVWDTFVQLLADPKATTNYIQLLTFFSKLSSEDKEKVKNNLSICLKNIHWLSSDLLKLL